MQTVIQVSEGFPGNRSASLMSSHSRPVEHSITFTRAHTLSRRRVSETVAECSVMGVKTSDIRHLHVLWDTAQRSPDEQQSKRA